MIEFDMLRTVFCSLLCGSLFLAHADILVNSGFETGDFTGWTQSGWFIDTTHPNSGVYDASTGCGGASCTIVGDPNSAYLYQDISTVAGSKYSLLFSYNSGLLATSGSELLVLWGSTTSPSLSTVVDFLNTDTSGAYLQYSGNVVATAATSRLEFLGRQDLDFYYLDDVSLTQIAVPTPEPESTFLFGGISFLLFAAYRALNTRMKSRGLPLD
jgi:hypothetical protein